jgi:hypothetical protein
MRGLWVRWVFPRIPRVSEVATSMFYLLLRRIARVGDARSRYPIFVCQRGCCEISIWENKGRDVRVLETRYSLLNTFRAQGQCSVWQLVRTRYTFELRNLL